MRNPIDVLLSLRAMLFLAALFFSTSALASPTSGTNEIKIVARQAPAAPAASPAAGTVLSTAEACAQYSRAANLSAIGSNTTIRSAFLEASPVGTMFNSALLNLMQANNKMLMMDAELNQACGNLSAIALQEVGLNFSMGIVGQFTFTENPVSVINGPIIILMTFLCLLIILGPASAM